MSVFRRLEVRSEDFHPQQMSCGFDAESGVACGELLAVRKNRLSSWLHGWTLHCSAYASLLSSTPVPISPAFHSLSPVFCVAMHWSSFFLCFYHRHSRTGSSIFGIIPKCEIVRRFDGYMNEEIDDGEGCLFYTGWTRDTVLVREAWAGPIEQWG